MAELTSRIVIDALNAEIAAEGDLARPVKGCYVSDLLSDVLAKNNEGALWITQHTHSNIVAVASVKGITAVIVVGGNTIPEDTLEKARAERVTLIQCGLDAFEAAGVVYNLLKGGSA
jgi:hypothetical protein